MDPNRPNFYKKITELFGDYRIDEDVVKREVVPDFCTRMTKKESKAYQTFIAKYMERDVRGLLVYHGLGSGKTRTGVFTMNSNSDRDVIIMIPASLRGRWINEVRNFKTNPNQRVTYVSYNASNFVDQVKRIRSLNGKLIIVDESHIFFQNVISGSAVQAMDVYESLERAKDIKFLFLTGTPISGDPFELVPMFNLLKGKMKTGRGRSLTLFPSIREEFWNAFTSLSGNSIKNVEVFKERIIGLVSYYKGLKDDYRYVIPENLGKKLIELPMGDIQWGTYLRIRREEARIEQIYKYKTTAFKEAEYKKAQRKSSGTYKVGSRMVSNFSVGTKIEEIYDAIVPRKGIVIDWSSALSQYPKLREVVLPTKKTNVSGIKWLLFTALIVDKIRTIDDLGNYSCKLQTIFTMIKERKKIKKFIYSEYMIFGTRLIAYFLIKLLGFTEVKDINGLKLGKKFKRFCVIDGNTKNKEKIEKLYNSTTNIYGEEISIILGTKVVSTGYTFKNVREIYILEPQWRDITIEQIIGRPIRLCSHALLPIEEREVQTYVFIAKPIHEDMLPRQDKGETTDQTLWRLATGKSEFINTFLHAIKEASIDCNLNIYVNQTTMKDMVRSRDAADLENYDNEDDLHKIQCKTCEDEENIDRVIIPPNYRDHLISGARCVMIETQTKLSPITAHDGLDSANKKHHGLRKDLNGNIYRKSIPERNGDIWEEVGYIKDSIVYLYEDDIDIY